MVEGTGLENRHTGNRIEGSNPSPSAVKNTCIFTRRGATQISLRCGGIRKAQAVYDFAKCNGAKLSPSPGRKFLTSDSEFRNLTPNPSPSADIKASLINLSFVRIKEKVRFFFHHLLTPRIKNVYIFVTRRGSGVHSIAHCVGIRKAQAVYDFAKCNGAKLSPSPGRKFLTSDSEFRNLTPNPSPSAVKNTCIFTRRGGAKRIEFRFASR